MFKKKLSTSLTALALFTFALGAEAVSLGDLNVESKKGEPFEAKLEIVDLDPTVSPLLVRIAPPAVYLREAKTVPEDVSSLKMERLPVDGRVVLRVYSQAPLKNPNFPLLVELNAGGTLTMREYPLASLPVKKTEASAAVKPAAEEKLQNGLDTLSENAKKLVPVKVTVREEEAKAREAAAREEARAHEVARLEKEKAEARAKAEMQARNEESRRQDRAFINRTARAIVRDYVSVNGFDAASPMRIQEGMTLWSVSNVYWPSYRGATAEQLLIGFRNKNKAAFIDGDPGRLQTGAMLYPPSSDEVFDINPVEAFREVHGDNVAIPLFTQNLIDAQLINAEVAEKVADAQDRARHAGKNAQAIAHAGRTTLEYSKTELTYERNLVTPDGKPLGETRQELADRAGQHMSDSEEKPAVKADAESAKTEETLAPEAEVLKTEAAQTQDEANAVTDAKAEDAKAEDTAAEPKVEAILPVVAPLETVEKTETLEKADKVAPLDAEKVEKAEKVETTEKLEKAAKTDQAAVSEETPKKKSNIPWTLIMGILLVIGFIWYFRRQRSCCQGKDEPKESCCCNKPVTVQKTIPPSSDAQLKALKSTVDECVKNGSTGGAMGVGTATFMEAKMAEEREKAEAEKRFKADENAVDPLIAPDAMSAEDRDAIEKTKTLLSGVSLDFDDEAEDKPSDADKTEKKAEAKVEEPAEPVKKIVSSGKDKAYVEALDARIELAEGFIKYGAIKEANEVFDEVIHGGTPEQKKRVEEIRRRLQKDGK